MTVVRLGDRIHARFPHRGLNKVAAQLATIAAQVQDEAPALRTRAGGLTGDRPVQERSRMPNEQEVAAASRATGRATLRRGSRSTASCP